MSAICFELLGVPRVRRGDREIDIGPPTQQALVSILALRAGQAVTRDELIAGIWGEQPPASAVNRIHAMVSGLRRVLEVDRHERSAARTLLSAGSGYRLVVEPQCLDVSLFTEATRHARALAAAADVSGAAAWYDKALSLWRGIPLAGVPGPRAAVERIRLQDLQLSAVEDRAQTLLQLREPGGLAAELSALAAEHPLRERIAELLILALHRQHRQAEALEVYRVMRARLIEQLGIEPGPGLQEAQHAVLRGPAPTPTTTRGDTATPGRNSAPLRLPPSLRGFVGRVPQLRELHAIAASADDGGPQIATVCGPAGIGKTALAVQWAHEVPDRFPDGRLCLDLRGFDPIHPPTAPTDAMRVLLNALNVPCDGVAAEAIAVRYQHTIAGRRMLLVLDNVRDAEQIRPLLPSCPGPFVVATSRNRLPGLIAVEGARTVPLTWLSTDEARLLLTRRLDPARAAAAPAAVEAIVAAAGGLPLALTIAAVRAATEPQLPLDVLAAELMPAGTDIDAFNGGDVTTDLRAALALSHSALSPGAARLFQLLNSLPSDAVLDVHAAASAAGVPLMTASALLAELVKLHLLERHSHGRYSIHVLHRIAAGVPSKAGVMLST